MKVRKEAISDYYIPRLQVHHAGQILMGTFTETRLKSLKSKRMEVTLKKLIKFANINRVLNEGSGIENLKPPEWWPADKKFKNLDVLKRRSDHKEWINLLRYLTANSINFYRKSPVDIQVFKKKRDYFCKVLKKNTGKVVKNRIHKIRKLNLNGILKPTSKKFNTFIKSPARKLHMVRIPLMEKNSTIELSTHETNSVINNNNNNTPSSPDNTSDLELKQNLLHSLNLEANPGNELINDNLDLPPTPLETLNLQFTPVVKIGDILCSPVEKESPKLDFMDFLKLRPSADRTPEKSRTPPPESTKYSSLIPFSSEMGKILIDKDRYKISKEIFNRKTDKLNYYLKEVPAASKDKDFEVACNLKKHPCNHFYRFPNRKYVGDKSYVSLLEKTFCKPVSVRAVNINVEKYFFKKYKCKPFSVVLEKLPVS